MTGVSGKGLMASPLLIWGSQDYLNVYKTEMSVTLEDNSPQHLTYFTSSGGVLETSQNPEKMGQDMMVHICNLNIWRLEAGGLLQV